MWRLRSANCYIRVTLLYFTHAVRSPAASSSVNYNLVGGCRLQSTADLLAASNLSSEPRRPPMSQPGSLFTNFEDVTVSGSRLPRRQQCDEILSTGSRNAAEPAHAQWEYFTLIYNKRLSCCRGTARRSTSLVDVVNSISYDD